MAHTFSCFLLSVVLGLWAVTAPVVSARPSPFDQPANVLNPIHADVFERTAGLKVRASTDFSRLSLEEQAHLVYGSDGGNDYPHIYSHLGVPSYMILILTTGLVCWQKMDRCCTQT